MKTMYNERMKNSEDLALEPFGLIINLVRLISLVLFALYLSRFCC